jgi:hypothetical protein
VLACLGLSCLCCLVSGTQIKNKLSGPEMFFSSPHLLSNLIPRQNELSSPAMVEYLALSSVWKACDLCNLIPRQNELSSPAMVEYLSLSSVWNACA